MAISSGSSFCFDHKSEISFLDRGPRDGKALLHFHGWPSSRIEQFAAQEVLEDLGIRWFSLDRPGYGHTAWSPKDTFQDWARRVGQWAESQNIRCFHVLGFSGGGPYAMACARYLPAQARSLTLLGSLAPFGKGACPCDPPWKGWGGFVLHRAPALGVAGFQLVNWLRKIAPREFELWQVRQTHSIDREQLGREDCLQQFEAAHAEAFRQGVRHIVYDLRMSARPWDFQPADIVVPTWIHVGSGDRQVPPEASRWLGKVIPRANLKEHPEEGHYLGYRYGREILEQVLVGD